MKTLLGMLLALVAILSLGCGDDRGHRFNHSGPLHMGPRPGPYSPGPMHPGPGGPQGPHRPDSPGGRR